MPERAVFHADLCQCIDLFDILVLGPEGRDDNQVTEAFFHHTSDEAAGNRMTFFNTIIPNFLNAMRSWHAHLSGPAAFSGRTSSQGASLVLRAIEPADIPIWLKRLDPGRTKTAEELDALVEVLSVKTANCLLR